MDKNLNSSPRLPWWVALIQMSPLILQLVSELVSRYQGAPLVISEPLFVPPDKGIRIPEPFTGDPE